MRTLTNEEFTELEMLVDKTSLESVLQSLVVMCTDKADHIQATYGDSAQSSNVQAWIRDSKTIRKMLEKIEN